MRSTRRTLKRRKDPPQAHLGTPTPDSVAQSHKLKRQCLSKGLPSLGQYLRSNKVKSEGKQKLVESALRSHLTKTQLRSANLKRFSNAKEETPLNFEGLLAFNNARQGATYEDSAAHGRQDLTKEASPSEHTSKAVHLKKALDRQEEP